MVTKKTRLMSALMAILMLVTLCTGIVLPASAVTTDYAMPEAPDNLIAYKNRKTSTDKKGDNGLINYAITDAEDWVKLAEDTNAAKGGGTFGGGRHYFNGWAFWFTDDLDFTKYSGTYNGSADATNFITRQLFLCTYYKATNPIADQGFRGQIYGQGHKITNLNVDITAQVSNGNYSYMGLIACGYDALVRDLTVDSSCSFKYTVGGMAKEWQTGVFGGHCDAMTYINCRNEAYVEINDLVTDADAGTITSGKNNSTSAFGRQTGALTMINCSNYGAITNNDKTRATGLAEWIGSAATIYNSYNVGKLTTNYSTPKTYTGAISTSVTSGLAADIKNCYNLGEDFASGTRSVTELDTMGTAISEDEYTSGKMAYLLNANAVETDYGKIYYTMVDGKAKVGEKATLTVKVVVTLEGTDDHVFYANAGQNIDIAHPDATNKATYALVDSTLGTVTGASLNLNTNAASATDLTIEVKTTDVPNTSALEEKLAEIATYGVEYYMKADGTVLTQSIVDTIRAKVTNESYTSYTQVAADLATLNTYVLHHPDAEDLKMVKEIYGILSSGCLSNAEGASIKADAAEAIALVEDADSAQEVKAANEALDAVIADFEAVDWVISKLVPYKFHENALFEGVKEWAIGDEEDWRAAVAQDKDFAGEKLTLTADIDMTADGDNSPVLPLRYGQDVSFAGTLDGDGHVFKNLYIEATPANHTYHVGLVSALTKNKGKVMNLGIESGEIKANWGIVNIDSGSNGFGLGGIVGQASGGTSIVKCWNAADVKVVPIDLIITDEIKASAEAKGTLDENGNCVLEDDISVGGIVGRGLSSSVIDGCFSIGTVTGLLHAAGLNDWGQATGAVYNSYDAATLIVNENGYGQAVRYNTNATTTPIVINTYAVGHRFSRVTTANKANTIDNSNLLPVVAASGELAYLLNEYAEDKGNGITYYKVENGKTVHATEDDRTFRITLKDDDGNVLYVYANGGTELTVGGETIDVTGDAEIEVADAAHDHNEVLVSNFFEGKDYVWSHQVRCDYATVIDGVTAYCSHEDDEQVDCTRAFRYVDGSADETHAHLADEYCTVCNAARHDRSHAASNVTGTVIEEAECLTAGKTTYTCSLCGDMYTLDQPAALEHEFIYTPNADHLTHKITCNRADCTLDEDADCTPDANGWTETVEPGEDIFGEKQAICDVCGGTIIVQLPKVAVLKADVQLAADEKTAEVVVSLKNNVAVKDLTLTVGYDQTAMSLEGVNAAVYGFSAVIDSNANGTAVITLTADADVTDALKDIVKLSFKMVTEDGNLYIPNKGYEIDISVEAANAAGEPVSYEKAIGEFTITQGFANIAGDFLRDGNLDTRDAMLLMRFYLNTLPAEYENVITEDAADLDTTYNNVDLGDGTNTGRINIYDVIHLLRILNGWG